MLRATEAAVLLVTLLVVAYYSKHSASIIVI